MVRALRVVLLQISQKTLVTHVLGRSPNCSNELYILHVSVIFNPGYLSAQYGKGRYSI